uniref:Restriction modification system DNA specificity domain n=1 Tax=Caulobacter sp. (strain K31) TaxID=366602 RepID=B0T4G0_CAUSK
MARRARLSPPREGQASWPWHKASFMALPISSLWGGERRLEAENYLSNGYGHRLALEARLGGHGRLGDVARVWQPSRLKGITVSRDFGTPFLAATQAFDLRPIPRKFLSLDRTETSSIRFAEPGTILVTCSGTVGRATLATTALAKTLISHDLLRVEPKADQSQGWVYGYLRSEKARQMMSSAQYGHIIKHLEPGHLQSLPMPRPRKALQEKFDAHFREILTARNRAVELFQQAEAMFGEQVGVPAELDVGEQGFSVPASSLMSGRRRLEGIYHNPTIRKLQTHFKERGFATASLLSSGFDAWLPGRFKRIRAEEGLQLVGSSDLFEINPDLPKRIADIDFGDRNSGRVLRGWLLLARSGQTYGVNGTLAIANAFHEGKIVSDHVIRIAPNDDCNARPGYIYTALSHPQLGRPMVKSLAYGSSIPEIDVSDIHNLPIVRLGKKEEDAIAELAEEGADLFARADIIETTMAREVDERIAALLEGDWSDFVPFSDK